MSTRGDIIRGVGGLLKRNTSQGIGVGPPHGGEEGDIRVNMVNHQPRLYAKAGNEWYNTPLFKAPISSVFEDSIGGTHLSLDGNSNLSIRNNRINLWGGVGKTDTGAFADLSIAIGNDKVMSSIVPTALSSNNVAIGVDVLQHTTECQYNVAMGSGAMKHMGLNAADVLADCERNVAIGVNALSGNSSGRPQGKENVAIGWMAMSNADTISDGSTMTCKWNTAVGANSGRILEGQYNTCIGSGSATLSLTTGNNNTLLGASNSTSNVGATNQTILGYGVTGIMDNTAVIGNASVTDVYMAQDSGATVHCISVTVKETTTPTALADHGKIYTKNDNKLYFQDGAGNEHEISLE